MSEHQARALVAQSRERLAFRMSAALGRWHRDSAPPLEPAKTVTARARAALTIARENATWSPKRSTAPYRASTTVAPRRAVDHCATARQLNQFAANFWRKKA